MTFPLFLVSSASAPLNLLSKINVIPSVISAEIDDYTPVTREIPRDFACRLAKQKLDSVSEKINGALILSIYTVVAVGRRIMPEAKSAEEVEYCVSMLSGRRHRVYTSLQVLKKDKEKILDIKSRMVTTIVKMKKLTSHEIQEYVLSGEGLGFPGGYNAQGLAQGFIEFIRGSYSNMLGLPLFEARNILLSLGYK